MKRLPHPAILVVAAVLTLDLLLLVLDTGPNLVAVTALGFVVGATVWFVVDVAPDAARPRPAVAGPRPIERSADLRITTLRQALVYSGNDHYLSERVQRSLIEVIDGELRATHLIDRHDDPGAAASVLGPELSRFVDDPDVAASMTARSLTRIVSLIEEI